MKLAVHMICVSSCASTMLDWDVGCQASDPHVYMQASRLNVAFTLGDKVYTPVVLY